MQVIYAHTALPTRCLASIFLAGPTPRAAPTPSWRPEALALLRARGFEGTVFVPEPEDGRFRDDYDAQVAWETAALARADCVLFWVPRDLDAMPAFTTNDEWGHLKDSGRVVFGAPPEAAKVRYQRWWAEHLGVAACDTLAATVDAALDALGPLGDGDVREGGACDVPLLVWRRPEFQRWYARLLAAGHRLDAARLHWTFRARRPPRVVVLWALQVDVWITAESRAKRNELLLGRGDLSATVLYRRGATLRDAEVVLVREFRSAGSGPDGFVHELPAGSSWRGADPRVTAAEEVDEECGVALAPDALREVGARPLAATLCVHHAHAYAFALDAAQMEALRASAGTPRGLVEHSEVTWVEVRRVGEILDARDVDWSTVGMILAALVGDGA
ncbi:MAG: nucleoside 2-deoxyribosyltransferase domain-containing protein [Polyangiales bacterium]